MPSHLHQELRVLWDKKRGRKKTGKGLWIYRRSGYVNVEINGQHFFYDEREEYDSVEDIHMKDAFATDRRTTTKKGKIVVKKKSKN